MPIELIDPYSIPPHQRWSGPNVSLNLSRLRSEQAAARAATPLARDPVDPLTAATLRIAELEGQVKALQSELDKLRSAAPPPHLRGVEKRAS
jgi:hypothetical protein